MNIKKLTTLALSISLITSSIGTTNILANELPNLIAKQKTPNIIELDDKTIIKASEEVQNSFNYFVNDDDTVTITKYTGNAKKFNVPIVVNTNIITSIGNSAFDSCNSLENIRLPNTIISIGDFAFKDCSNLTSIELPDSITSIGEGAFNGCNNLVIECYENSYAHTYAVENNIDFILISNESNDDYEYSINDDNTITITKYTGKDTEVIVPNEIDGKVVTSIGIQAFLDYGDLTSIELPDSIISIGDGAFRNCTGLASIELPNGVTSIGGTAFERCISLTSIELPNSITSIGWAAFSNCNDLTNIKLPNKITSIGDSTFYNCNSLTSIEIPDSVISIGETAFMHCSSLTNVEFSDSLTFIGDNAFYSCQNLMSIELPNSLTSIGNSAFYNCRRLTNIELPDSITSIGEEAFRGCYNLVIKCYENSHAHTYAIKNNIDFILISKDTGLQEAIEKANKAKDSNNINELLNSIKDLSDAIVKYNK